MKTIGFTLLISMGIVLSACTKNTDSHNQIAIKNSANTGQSEDIIKPLPYAVLQLGDIWKLSVPVDANGGNTGSATTISNNKLKQGYSSDYFYTVDSPYTNVVRLWCPVNGATTTPGQGSDHPRTELAEYPLTWYSEDQAQIIGEIIGGRLTAVTAVKQHGPSADIIIGQIHGAGSVASGYPFVMLHLRHDSIIAYVKGDTVGNAGTVKSVLLKNVALGTKIHYSITDSTDNHIYFKVTAAGATGTGTWNAVVPEPWKTVQLRFSAGNYLQDHDPNAPASMGSKVNLYSLHIDH